MARAAPATRVLCARPPARLRVGQARHRARRHRLGRARQHAGDARMPLRRADGGRGAQHRQHQARRRPDRFQFDHAETKVLITDREFSKVGEGRAHARQGEAAGGRLRRSGIHRHGRRLGTIEYEDILREAMPTSPGKCPTTSGTRISLNYTSGTTGDPKGVVYHHRGAYLLAIGNVLTAASASTASISGRCRCFIATAGAFRGRSRWWPAPMCACAQVRARGDVRCHRRPQGDASLRAPRS